MSINSNTRANHPLGSSLKIILIDYNSISINLTTFSWGDNFFKHWISLKLLTYSNYVYYYFMHLIATKFLFLSDFACNTSLKVPSPFFIINLYSLINFNKYLHSIFFLRFFYFNNIYILIYIYIIFISSIIKFIFWKPFFQIIIIYVID